MSSVTMTDSIVIKAFIDKVRLARSSNSKDIRLTMEEASELVAWIAMINCQQDSLDSLHQKIDKLTLTQVPEFNQPKMDGGRF